MRVMIAGVGYTHMRDLSVGPVLVEQLRALDWPDGVDVDDWSFGPIAVVQRLEALPERYDRVVLVSSVQRDRPPGTVHQYRWDGVLPDAEEIQQRVGEAVMGVVALDNLLVVAGHFGALPDDIVVIEIEPEDYGWGEGFSPCVNAAVAEIQKRARQAALAEADERECEHE